MPPKKSIEQTYQKKTQLEHVLHRSQMYIGDTNVITADRWIITDDHFVKKAVSFSPGLHKIFDEVLTNAVDHSKRDPTMKRIEVSISGNGIVVYNDGDDGIPIEIHKELGKYVPEIIFSDFHTSSNYDDTEERIVAGTNGLGVKLTNIFSTEFTIEICDNTHIYTQSWNTNMTVVGQPVIVKTKKKSYTKITFTPDYPRFGNPNNAEMVELFKSRMYECSAITGPKVGV
jgi:DNA topoisomerase-2